LLNNGALLDKSNPNAYAEAIAGTINSFTLQDLSNATMPSDISSLADELKNAAIGIIGVTIGDSTDPHAVSVIYNGSENYYTIQNLNSTGGTVNIPSSIFESGSWEIVTGDGIQIPINIDLDCGVITINAGTDPNF
jgi:hypothetical protein